MKSVRRSRKAYTLLELLLSLGLIVVATALVGSLMSLYARSFATKGDQIKQKQLARSLLTMIADDIRAVVVAQEYDETALAGMLGGGAAPTTGTGTGTGTDPATSGAAGTSETTDPAATAEETEVALPPGIYGSRYQLMVDVSRIPRNNEYTVNAGLPGAIVDVPGDVKTVTYLMQASNPLGVQDTMQQVATSADSVTSNSGLVRRAIDRLVLKYSEETATTSQLTSSGELVAPEVVSLEFSYYDGTQWVYDWDSSLQGLPWLVQINLALQSPASAELNPIGGGIALSTMTLEDQQTYGIQVFELTVAIPGAQLQAIPSSDAGTGMESMGL